MQKKVLHFSTRDRVVYTALAAVPGVGQHAMHAVRKYLRHMNSNVDEFWKKPKMWSLCRLTQAQQDALREFQKTRSPENFWEELQRKNIRVLLHTDKNYPFLLKQNKDCPFLLFVRGPSTFWNELPVAIVGTRKITPYGELVTEKITRELVAGGATIISGFMFGVDILAHQTAVKAGGKSVGVLGFGFDHFYPDYLQKFSEEFLAAGNTLVTEFAPEVPPMRSNFPMRNRIVAGFSQAVVVTEAAARSGSLITAQYGIEYDRSVCTVAGPITSPFSEGTKKLLNEGAVLVSSGGEVLAEIGQMQNWNASKIPPRAEVARIFTATNDQNALYAEIVEHLKVLQSSADELSEVLHLPIAEVSTALSMMELNGEVKRQGQKWSVGRAM